MSARTEHMTTAQQSVYNAIERFWKENGYGPSLNDLANILGRPTCARSGIQQVVDRLVRKGFCARTHGVGRSLRPIPEAERTARAQASILDRIAGDVATLSPEAKAQLRERLSE